MGYKKWELNPKVAPTVRAEHHNAGNVHFVVSGQTNGTNTPTKSTKNIMENAMTETSEQLTLTNCQTSIYSVLDSLARVLASLEKEKDLKTLEAQCFLKSLGLQSTKDPDIYSLKTSRVCLVTTAEKLSPQYLGFSPTWGIELNGWYLTASTLEFPKTGNGCSLSDILETDVADKYFLSEKQVKGLLKGIQKPQLLERSQQEVTQEDITQV